MRSLVPRSSGGGVSTTGGPTARPYLTSNPTTRPASCYGNINQNTANASLHPLPPPPRGRRTPYIPSVQSGEKVKKGESGNVRTDAPPRESQYGGGVHAGHSIKSDDGGPCAMEGNGHHTHHQPAWERELPRPSMVTVHGPVLVLAIRWSQ